ncbi:MAG: hypothetical protein PF486_13255 [Prolixibacteraceae bacterium]|jgi:alpha-tubulin suppressor-like RCC1 family protein|nr:hypothetical protein [Prolixibacteraceae bacterium]
MHFKTRPFFYLFIFVLINTITTAQDFRSSKILDFSTSGKNVFATDQNGNIWAWGANNNTINTDSETIIKKPFFLGNSFKKIQPFESYTLAIDNNNHFWSWGKTESKYSSVVYPKTKQSNRLEILQINSGVFIDIKGKLFTFDKTKLNNDLNYEEWTSAIMEEKTFTHVTSSDRHTIAIDSKGRAWGWGTNSDYQLGDSVNSRYDTPINILPDKKFITISAG